MIAQARRIRVLVAEDSRFMRRVIRQILASDPEIDVVGFAADGAEAVEAVANLAPDVVTMDVKMPRLDGLSAVERIMERRPTPILMLSSQTQEGSAAAIRALELGAVDFIAKPSGSVDLDLEGLREEIIRKVKMAARVRPVRTTATRTGTRPAAAAGSIPRPESAPSPVGGDGWAPCVVIGASTGGPAALLKLIPELPRGCPASVLIVQHMPSPYTAQLAGELAARAALPVKEAESGERLERGVVYISPGSRHLTLSARGAVNLHLAPRNGGECPSADLAMTSVAEHLGPLTLGVVLTGMGRDGAAGARRIKQAGGVVIAQDEASSAVYGMPRAALETGCVDAVVSLSDLPEVMLACVGELVARRVRKERYAS